MAGRVRVSVVVVAFNSADTLEPLWASLRPELGRLGPSELFLVDNASTDASVAVLGRLADEARRELPECRTSLLLSERNVGFAAANNAAIRRACGDAVLLLNPDTVVEPGAIERALAYLEADPTIGIVGPRVLLADGRLDAPCRRSFKTPGIYFYHWTGLSRLFPRSRRFGRYYLSYLDERETTDVDAIIGACLLIRRATIGQIGLLDERFFMYCEDEDWCFRAKAAGWRVVYFPESVVWHLKGASRRSRPLRTAVAWHVAIMRFHRKNLARRHHPLTNAFIYSGLLASLAASATRSALSQLTRLRRGQPRVSPFAPAGEG